MTWLSDPVVAHLRTAIDAPDFGGTRYTLGEPIGRGGMATVFRAHDRTLDRDVAVKVLDEPVADEGLADRLLAEAKVIARLEHPAIVPVHDAGTLPDGRPYAVMKLIRGRDLSACAETLGSVPERLRLFERVCEAVAFAHARGVIHRDLKPANVMVGAFGEVLVLDWGLARSRVARDRRAEAAPLAEGRGVPETAHGAVLGTPGFMAPEQRLGGPVDERADIHALGVLLGWLLGIPPGHAGRPASVPPPLVSIVRRASAERPADRYASADDLIEDVRRYLDGLAVSAHAEGALERIGRFARRHRIAIALVAAYLVMRMALLVYGRL